MADNKLWVDNRHPEYAAAKNKRAFARDHYSGAAEDEAVRAAALLLESNVVSINSQLDTDSEHEIRILDSLKAPTKGKYLYQRAQGESVSAFQERALITPFPGLMGAMVDSYVGGVFSVEEKAVREYGEPLGKPTDKDSVLYTLGRDIDGSGLSWGSSLIHAVQDVVVDDISIHKADRLNPESKINIYRIEPDDVLNWREDNGLITELLMREIRLEHGARGLMEIDGPVEVEYYILYTLEGWERWKLVEEKNRSGNSTGVRKLVSVGGSDYKYPFWTTPDQERQRLPFGFEQMPIGRGLGYRMAQDHNSLYNLLSDSRWLIRIANHPKLRGDVDDDQFNSTMEALRLGFNALQGNWDYIGPDPSNAAVGYGIYRDETNRFFVANNQRMTESNIERSATEILFNEAAGRTSQLTLLSDAADEIENDRLFLASQLEAPLAPETWYKATVKRDDDFRPIDNQALMSAQSIAFAALANTLPAEIAAEVVRDGFTEKVQGKLNNLRLDFAGPDEPSPEPNDQG